MRFNGNYFFTDEELLEIVAKFLNVTRDQLKDPVFAFTDKGGEKQVTGLRVGVDADSTLEALG